MISCLPPAHRQGTYEGVYSKWVTNSFILKWTLLRRETKHFSPQTEYNFPSKELYSFLPAGIYFLHKVVFSMVLEPVRSGLMTYRAMVTKPVCSIAE